MRFGNTRLELSFGWIPPLLRPHAAAIPSPEHDEVYDVRLALRRYVHSVPLAKTYKHAFDAVRYYTFFVGWPRSGSAAAA